MFGLWKRRPGVDLEPNPTLPHDVFPPSWEVLNRMSDAQIYEAYDARVRSAGVEPSFWRDEIAIRAAERETNRMVLLTIIIAFMTLANTAFVIYSVFR